MTANLFDPLSSDLPEEIVEILIQSQDLRIERIVSTGHSSPKGFWYDQAEHEWVVVLKGEARLVLDGPSAPIHLHPGDYLNIPAHQKHRIEWTSPNEPTVWLAVFYRSLAR